MSVKIGIIMGSDSDLPVMSEACKVLEILKIDYEVTVVSAHRTPERLFTYAKEADDRGIDVIIAGAGGAAHLPGMVASITTVPVIGVPVKSRTMNGIDSLYSIVQMPPGIPVATVAINGAKNAGILAAQIASLKDITIKETIQKYKDDLKAMVEEKALKLEDVGYEKYLKDM